MGLLDYEIWKTSRMMVQSIPLQVPPTQTSNLDKWEDFGPYWK